MSKKKNLNKPVAITILIISLLVAMCILGILGTPGLSVASFLIGTFGLAVYAYTMCAILVSLTLLFGFRISVSFGTAIRYIGVIFAIIFVLHTATSVELIGELSYFNYAYACYTSVDTAGGLMMALITYVPMRYLGFWLTMLIGVALTILLIATMVVPAIRKKQSQKGHNIKPVKRATPNLTDFADFNTANSTQVVGEELAIFSDKDIKRESEVSNNNSQEFDIMYPNKPQIIEEYQFGVAPTDERTEEMRREDAYRSLFDFRDTYRSPDCDTPNEPYQNQTEDTPIEDRQIDEYISTDNSYRSYTNNYRMDEIEKNRAAQNNARQEQAFNELFGEPTIDSATQPRTYNDSFANWVINNQDSEVDTQVNEDESVSSDPNNFEGSIFDSSMSSDDTYDYQQDQEYVGDNTNTTHHDDRVTDNDAVVEDINYSEEFEDEIQDNNVDTVANREYSYKPGADESGSDGTQFSVSKKIITPTSNTYSQVARSVDPVNVIIEENTQPIKPIEPPKPIVRKPYIAPPIDLLKTYAKSSNNSIEYFEKNKKIIEETLANFNVSVTVESSTRGAAFTRFELKMAPGVPVASVKKYEDDIAMNLEALSMRMEAPIPGKNLVGIEIPRPSDDRDIIGLRQVFEDSDFFTKNRSLAFALGTNIAGESIIGDLEKMPHLLISGGTGSGKSICMNTIICSLLYKYSPEYVRFILVDPKQVEFNIYNDLPHLLVKEVISDTEKAINALNWAIKEMEQRYTLFKTTRCKNISDYNTFIESDKTKPRMPYIVFIIDELADLMSTKKKDVEDKVQRLAQKARAAGILLILATQRPSVDIISGVIKTNLPSRIALSLSNYQDSKTILDRGGAEKLLGNGDMLYFPMGMMDPVRLQGAYLSNSEIASITEYVCTHNESYYDNAIDDAINTVNTPEVESASEAAGPQYVTPAGGAAQDMDFLRALRFCVENKKASISSIQSALALGFPKASRYIMMMERKGYISVGNNSSKPRDVYMTLDQFIEQFGDVGQIEI